MFRHQDSLLIDFDIQEWVLLDDAKVNCIVQFLPYDQAEIGVHVRCHFMLANHLMDPCVKFQLRKVDDPAVYDWSISVKPLHAVLYMRTSLQAGMPWLPFAVCHLQLARGSA